MQLYIVPSTGGKPRKLTNLTGYLTDPRFSPDSTRIAVLFAENAPSGGGPLEAEPIETGVIGGEIHNQRMTLVDAATGATKQVSPADMNVYEYDWSPDGSSFALSAAPGPGDNNWWIAQLYTMSADTGKMKSIFKPETQIAVPRWSPDGTSIAFIQGLMSDEGFTGGDVLHHRVLRRPSRQSHAGPQVLRQLHSMDLAARKCSSPKSPAEAAPSAPSNSPPAAPSASGKAAKISTPKATSRTSR